MEQSEIIRMALEAGFEVNYYKSLESEEVVSFDPIITYNLERFAALVAANLFTYDQVKAHIQAAVITEREACAKVCEDWHFETEDPRDVAAAIRSRCNEH